jgi:chromosomal replication initiation ATPase DnaA
VIRQFVFDLGAAQSYGPEDYFPAPSNASAYAQLMGADPLALRLLLCGPAGSGKTHLAHLWAAQSGAQIVPAAELAGRLAQIGAGPLVVEDAPLIAGDIAGQEALFHLWNRAQGRALLITGRGSLPDWGLYLPDLVSRLQSMAVAQLDPPDEALLSAVLVKLFADRQVHVQPNLIAYLVPRMERSIAAARQIVGHLDAQALALGKPITRALAVEILGGQFASGEDMDSDPAE